MPAQDSIPRKGGTWLKRAGESFRHPLALLLVSSILIPSIVYWLQARNTLREARQKKALEIVSRNADFEGQLYSLYTDLSFFNANNQSLLQPPKSPEDPGAKKTREDQLRKNREEFKKEFANRYIEFTKLFSDQHLWVDDLAVEGVVLRLFTAEDVRNKSSNPDLTKLLRDIETYRRNVADSRIVLGRFQDLLISEGRYDPNKISGEWVTGTYNKLRDQRRLIVDELVGDFMPRGSFVLF
jgi:hypothetical protein